MTRNLESRLNVYSPTVLSIFRAVFGFLFAAHGASVLFAWPVDFGGPAPVGMWPLWWAGLIELITGLLVMVGLFTRVAAFIASGQMAVAYFWQHQPHALWPIHRANGGELAVLYCFAFLLLVFTGGGAYALDARRRPGGVPAGRGAGGRFGGGFRRANRGFGRRR
jgi:putative oxidoreductase